MSHTLKTEKKKQMESKIVLTKESSSSDLESYFRGVLELDKQRKEYPVNLDEVWQLCYAEKGKAVRALKTNFIENVDFISIAKNGKTAQVVTKRLAITSPPLVWNILLLARFVRCLKCTARSFIV